MKSPPPNNPFEANLKKLLAGQRLEKTPIALRQETLERTSERMRERHGKAPAPREPWWHRVFNPVWEHQLAWGMGALAASLALIWGLWHEPSRPPVTRPLFQSGGRLEAGLTLFEGGSVYVPQGTQASLKNLKDQVAIVLISGQVEVKVVKGRGYVAVETTAGRAIAFGTHYRVSIQGGTEMNMTKRTKQLMQVVVMSGVVQLTNSWGGVALAAGEAGAATDGSAPAKQQEMLQRLEQTRADLQKDLSQLPELVEGRFLEFHRTTAQGKTYHQWKIRRTFFLVETDRQQMLEDTENQMARGQKTIDHEGKELGEDFRWKMKQALQNFQNFIVYLHSLTDDEYQWMAEHALSQEGSDITVSPPNLFWAGMEVGASTQPLGVKVLKVDKGGPAEQCGLKVDDVIEQVEQVRVKTPREFFEALSQYQSGAKVECRGTRPPATDLKVRLEIASRSAWASGAGRAQSKEFKDSMAQATKSLEQSIEEVNRQIAQLQQTPADQFMNESHPTITFTDDGNSTVIKWDRGLYADLISRPPVFLPVKRGRNQAELLKALEVHSRGAKKSAEIAHAYQRGEVDLNQAFKQITNRVTSHVEDTYKESLVKGAALSFEALKAAKAYIASMPLEEFERLGTQHAQWMARRGGEPSDSSLAWLGVSTRQATPEEEKKTGAAVIIMDVKSDSQAARAGLKKGDGLLKIEGQPVPDTKSVANILSVFSNGSRVKVEVARDGKSLSLLVVLEAKP